ncbi:uncharacterized protein BYT42DRAFT_576990 [Radiomyces spectabilis]|uniref:uncharacterized protein n=1 Tax=Radiomyces spectabilis TaxID=64574 RepID=UPI00221E6E6A|nr:uncharacterized protein BYT42DRAFT_576990 [Radiomyces spectabilis]KAI8374605.1 hypothetical protein BYT42DRAFT_576990 [Radiomyces spectabilis]
MPHIFFLDNKFVCNSIYSFFFIPFLFVRFTMIIESTDDIILDAANVLMEEAQALRAAATRLQMNAVSRDGYKQAIYLMFRALDCGGKIVVTGVGKSGKIGEKIVATMLSTGTCATFLHPVEALHGDLGTVQANDVVLALSFSGNTEELLMLLPSLKHRKVPVVGLGGNPNSKLARECAAWLDGFAVREAGGEIPAPTSSTTLALAVGDALALSLAKLRRFDTAGFALNHPGGTLGRRLLLKVRDAMVPADHVASVMSSASLDVVIMEMTKYPKGGCVIVLKDEATEELFPSPPSSAASDEDVMQDVHSNTVAGVITHGDIHRILKTSARDNIFHAKAGNIMTSNPIMCNWKDLASDAMRRMIDHNPKNYLPLLPVTDDDRRWRGVVTLKDLQELF